MHGPFLGRAGTRLQTVKPHLRARAALWNTSGPIGRSRLLPHRETKTAARKPADTLCGRQMGQLFMMGFDGTSVSPQIRSLIEDYHLGSVLLSAKNLKCSHLRRPQFLSSINFGDQCLTDV